MDRKQNKEPAILRTWKDRSFYGCKKYMYFPEDSEYIEFETDSKEEMMIWLDLRGLKIGKRYRAYEKYVSNAIDYEVKGL